jgi:N-acetylglucosamine-6-phosphate deacetylase
MAATVLLAAGAYTPSEIDRPVAVAVRDGRIDAVSIEVEAARHSTDTVLDLGRWRVAPGYIDLHTHGFGGHDVTSGTEADIEAMAMALPATGVTAFLPTIASTGPAETRRQVERVTAAMRHQQPRAAEVLGIRLEGPFINRARKGAQDESAIRPPDLEELRRLAGLGPIRIVDFAPEQDADFGLLRALVQADILSSIGHTAASYEQTLAAIDAGARHCTHLFNAMPPLEHRAPGAVGALLADSRATVEVIADGVHVHPAILRLVCMARGAEAVALVTDAMSAAGLPPGDYTFLGRHVSVRDGAVRLADATLAGSVLTMDAAVRNLVNLAGASWSEAIRMATLTPATIAGLAGRKGRLAPGADADLVVLDDAGVVRQAWRGGERVYAGDGVPRSA